ncbi:MAG: prepilin-type N-terminal cleavage/methylation domain-containing protein [Verrucomicrobiae bacterium]|nr:prepilin-type N-terminal cleavage/methylation domain-containing protein [Verrucomicrobiae bacterium]NNJ44095.1 prepilin-type N-terminal cleavage/methylation domain-containing protein [Akkermansiaceae bacterium]
MKIQTKRAQGFTLVELLVVIAIIAALAVIATPAVLRALTKAKITRVSAICKSVEMAVDGFEGEYNFLPYGGNDYPATEDELSDADNDGLMAVLAGLEDEINMKSITYFTQEEPKGNSDATYKDGMHVDRGAGTAALYDPWGDRYRIMLDYIQGGDDDGIEHPYNASEIIRRKIVIYSYGPDGKVDTTSITNRDNKDNPSNF